MEVLARGEASASGGGVDADVAELAVKCRAAHAEPPCDFGHPAAIMTDGKPDDVRFDLFEGAQMSVVREQGHASSAAEGRIAGLLADLRSKIALPIREARLARNVREILGSED